MSTSGTSLASLASAITAPQTTSTSTSTFSTDLQNAVNRAVQIASLPIQQLTQNQANTNNQITELNTLTSDFSAIQTALQSLSSGTGAGALAATSSDTSVAQASLTGAALPGTYTINVTDPGSPSSALSNETSTPITDPTSQDISQSGTFTLTVGPTNYTITASAQNLNALASDINNSGAPVQAVVINLGTTESPDYRLALQSTNLGDVSLQLNDGTADLLSPLATGGPASYTVDGLPPGGITSDTSTVTVAPGLNVSLDSAGTSTITVAGSTATLSSALSSFVNAFNAAVTELQKNHGQNGGALVGDSSVYTAEGVLRQIANFSGSGTGITSLTQLGVEFTQTGTLTFSSSTLSGLSQTQINQAVSFLGDINTGGFLQSANDSLNSVIDPTTGVFSTELQNLQTQSQHEQQQITNAQATVTTLQTNLLKQMAIDDALIATLQQQSQFVTSLFQTTANDLVSGNPNGNSSNGG